MLTSCRAFQDSAMNESDFNTAFSSLRPNEQASLLAALAHHLTVCARAIEPSEAGHEKAMVRLLALNELQQTITGQLLNLITDDNRRYPDHVFADVLFETARTGNSESDLEWALGLALRGFRDQSSP